MVIIVVIYFLVIKGDGGGNNNNAKRGLETIQTLPFISPVPINSRIVGRGEFSTHLAQEIKNRINAPLHRPT